MRGGARGKLERRVTTGYRLPVTDNCPTRTDAPYTGYAAHYDRQGQSRWSETLLRFALTTLVPRYGRRPRVALDLACGTGTGALLLARAGLATIGLDRSAAMLAIARAKASAAQARAWFVRGDLREFAFRRRFDLVTCCYDSLNYLLDPADLARAFARVRDALAPGGLFIGDLNTARAYGGPVGGSDWSLDLGESAYGFSTTWDPASRRAETVVTCATRAAGRTNVLQERHRQRAYELPEVAAAVEASGLRLLDAFAARSLHDPTLGPPGPETARIIYVAAAGATPAPAA